MAIGMYDISAPVFIQYLTALSGILDKAAAFAEARKIEESVLLSTRLYPDMYSLAKQVQTTADHACMACAKLSGVEAPDFANDEASIAALKGRIARAIEFVGSFRPDQLNGSENKEIVFKLPRGDIKFTGQQYLVHFALANFYFHDTAAYAILRQLGVEIGKRDFAGTPPGA